MPAAWQKVSQGAGPKANCLVEMVTWLEPSLRYGLLNNARLLRSTMWGAKRMAGSGIEPSSR